jgi:hypothetical protein
MGVKRSADEGVLRPERACGGGIGRPARRPGAEGAADFADVLVRRGGATLGFSAVAQPGPLPGVPARAGRAQRACPRPAAHARTAGVGLPIIAAALALLTQVPPDLLRGLAAPPSLAARWAQHHQSPAAPSHSRIRPPPIRSLERGSGADAWRVAPPRAVFSRGLLVGGNAARVLGSGAAGRLGPGPSRVLGALSSTALLGAGTWQIARGGRAPEAAPRASAGHPTAATLTA